MTDAHNIIMNRFSTAAAIQTTITHLSIKSVSGPQKQFIAAMVRILEKERDDLNDLGRKELSLLQEEKVEK